MDESQITGTASSYARKYALNGLFLIDDTKDADTDEYTNTTKGVELATDAEKKKFKSLCEGLGVDYKEVLKQVGVTGQMTKEQYAKSLILLRDVEDSKR